MDNSLEELCHKYNIPHGRVYDAYKEQEARMARRNHNWFYSLMVRVFSDGQPYNKEIVKILDRKYNMQQLRAARLNLDSAESQSMSYSGNKQVNNSNPDVELVRLNYNKVNTRVK